MTLFKGLLLTTLFSAAVAQAFDVQIQAPMITVDGVAHEIAVRDLSTSERFDTANGFCALNGQGYAMVTTSTVSMGGPYVVTDASGNLLATYPAAGNEGRFKVAVGIRCSN